MTMNFDYIQDAKPETEELKNLYASLYRDLEEAEAVYWSDLKKCAMLLRQVAEKVCHVYNSYYTVGYPEGNTLESYLCYTDDEENNVMVSRFLSVVRTEQRDRLEWIRVWGDECAQMDVSSEMSRENADKLYLNVKKMMVYILDVTREMCEKIDHMEELDGWIFEEDLLPGYLSEEERKKQEKKQDKENKKSIFSFLRKK